MKREDEKTRRNEVQCIRKTMQEVLKKKKKKSAG